MSYYKGGSVNSQPFGLVYNTAYPNGTIPSGDPNATITNFDPANGLFVPIYQPVSGVTFSFDANKSLILSGPGPQDGAFVIKQVFAGIRARTRLYPDNTGVLKFEFKMKDMTWTAAAVANFLSTAGLILYGPQFAGEAPFIGIGFGLASAFFLATLDCHSTDVSVLKNGNIQIQAGTNLGLASPQAGPIWIRITMNYDTTPNPDNLLVINNTFEYSFNHAAWNTFINANPYMSGWDIFNGVGFGFGIMANYKPQCSFTVESFTLLNGYMSL